MRLRILVVLLCVSGCRQSPLSEPPIELAQPPSQEAPGPAADQKPPAQELQVFQPAVPLPPPVDEVSDRTWSAVSADGKAEVRQTAARQGKTLRCTIVSTLSLPSDVRSVMWNWQTCVATRAQLRFVSPNGQRLMVIDPVLASVEGNWKNLEVVALYEHGLRIRSTPAVAFLRDEEAVRRLAPDLGWVKAPRYTSDGAAVELETVEGESFRLGFDGQGFPAADLYRYEDGAGAIHFASSKAVVPPPIGVLPGGGSREEETPRPSEPPSPERPLPVGAPPTPKDLMEELRKKSPVQLLEEVNKGVKTLQETRKALEGNQRPDPRGR
jgi:hypothetical protein